MTKNKIKFHFHFFILFSARLETALWYQNVLIYFCYYSGSFGNTYSKSIDENVWPPGRGRARGGSWPDTFFLYGLFSYFLPPPGKLPMSLCGCNKVILVCVTMNKSKITITTTQATTTTQRPQLPLPHPPTWHVPGLATSKHKNQNEATKSRTETATIRNRQRGGGGPENRCRVGGVGSTKNNEWKGMRTKNRKQIVK